MTHRTDNERLLDDMLGDASPAGFREALLGETLRLARHRRRFRQTQRAAATLAVLGVLAALVSRNLPRHPAVSPPPVVSYEIIHTQPWPVAAIVTTQPLSADRLVASVATADIVQTTATGRGFREIDDDQLLALVAPRPAALVRLGPHSAELVFVNPADQDGFPVD